ncbi:MAG: hypothetical protein ACLP8S_05295 [Solirubrobacteraceae bacterium]
MLPELERTAHRYQAAIGALGLALVLAFSVYLFANGSPSAPGVAAGRALPRFVAPLASSDLNVPANAHPRCDPARPARRGLNVCGRRAIVLSLFAPGARACVQSVGALAAISRSYRQLQFAAVAVNASKTQTEALVRAHDWPIPVAYDSDGAIAALYNVSVCPLIELARPGGLVAGRLIGNGWTDPARLAAQVQRLLGGG